MLLIFFVVPLITNSISLEFHSVAIKVSIHKRALVACAIGPLVHSLAVLVILLELPRVFVAVGARVYTVASAFAIFEGALVLPPVRVDNESFAFHLVFLPGGLNPQSVLLDFESFSAEFALLELPLVICTARPVVPPVALLVAVLEGASVFMSISRNQNASALPLPRGLRVPYINDKSYL